MARPLDPPETRCAARKHISSPGQARVAFDLNVALDLQFEIYDSACLANVVVGKMRNGVRELPDIIPPAERKTGAEASLG